MAQQQIVFDIADAEKRSCKKCGGVFFDKAFRLGEISKLCPRNKTGKEITVEFPTYVCRGCGEEVVYKAGEVMN